MSDTTNAAAGYWEDDEREEGTITEVREPQVADSSGHSHYEVTSSTGWSCGVSTEYGVVPKVGDRFTTWGRIGFPIRGQAINDRVLYYRTPDEQRAEDQKQSDKLRAERIAEYESQRADYDRRVAALPEPLRLRVEGFRAHGGDAWRWEYEPYEMACCEEAARLVAHFMTGDAIKAFSALDYAAQKAEYPEMDAGHSGNTWGTALRLAYFTATNPAMVPEIHAGICALMGCESAGCFAVRPPLGRTTG